MAEEDLDLEDDDIDLGGDEFAGELDNMMGDDELGGEKPAGGGASGGGGAKGEDSDSELDSFFEDLSSIEDMDEGGSGGAPAAAATSAPAAEAKVAPKAKKAEPKAKKKGGKLKYLFLLLVLLGGGGGAYYWFFMQHPVPLVDMMPEIEPPPIEQLKIEQPEVKKIPIQPMIEVEPPPPPPPVKPVEPKKRYLVQVATCSYDVCKEDYTETLRMAGEPVFQRNSGEKYDFIELVTSQVFSFREAEELSKEINIKNKLAGIASIKSQSNGYRISMGSFPSLDRAKEIKLHIEKLFPSKNVTFNMEHVRRDYTTTKIYAGPYNSNAEARKALMALKSSEKFKGAFIVLF